MLRACTCITQILERPVSLVRQAHLLMLPSEWQTHASDQSRRILPWHLDALYVSSAVSVREQLADQTKTVCRRCSAEVERVCGFVSWRRSHHPNASIREQNKNRLEGESLSPRRSRSPSVQIQTVPELQLMLQERLLLRISNPTQSQRFKRMVKVLLLCLPCRNEHRLQLVRSYQQVRV